MSIIRATQFEIRALNESVGEKRWLDIAVIAFFISVMCFIISSTWEWGIIKLVLEPIGIASCGFAWILSRSFFKPHASEDIWPLFIIGLLIGIGLLLNIFLIEQAGTGAVSTGLIMLSGLRKLLSSTVLVLAFLEPWLSYRSDFPQNEKCFRQLYTASYGSLLIVSCLWLNSVSEGSWADQSGDIIKLFCASIAAAAGIFGWRYRRENPLPKQKRRQRNILKATDDEQELSKRILTHIQEGESFLEPNLKLSDLAKSLNECDHKVRNCITGVLNFRNFNHFINHHRIKVAKDALAHPSKGDISILAIAFDCGFSSIGPFNRAFRQETGLTPSSFRSKSG